MLSIRTRGKNGIYYIRGTVTLGDKHIEVKEFSSGTSDRDAASHLMAEHETKLRHRLMFGPAAIVAQGRISCGDWHSLSPRKMRRIWRHIFREPLAPVALETGSSRHGQCAVQIGLLANPYRRQARCSARR